MSRARAVNEDQFARLAPHYDALMANVPYGLWVDYVSRLATLGGRPIWPGSRLLDLATGTGSVALEFARRGCLVVGVDLSAPMIAEAERKAALEDLPARFLVRDLCDFDLPAEFDHAVCLYDSLNYILDPEDLQHAFAHIERALKPGALLIFDVNTVRALDEEMFTQKSRPGAPVEYQWKSKYDPRTRTSRIRMDFHVLSTGEKFRIMHRQRAYTEAEIRSLLFQAGFTNVTTYDAYRSLPPGPESDRVFYVVSAET